MLPQRRRHNPLPLFGLLGGRFHPIVAVVDVGGQRASLDVPGCDVVLLNDVLRQLTDFNLGLVLVEMRMRMKWPSRTSSVMALTLREACTARINVVNCS